MCYICIYIYVCVLYVYVIYNIIHRRFKTASIIGGFSGFSGFAGGEGTYPPRIAAGYCIVNFIKGSLLSSRIS